MAKLMDETDIRLRSSNLGVEAVGSVAEALSEPMRRDLLPWRTVARRAGIRPE